MPESAKTTLSEPQVFYYKLFLSQMRSFLGNRDFIQMCKYPWKWGLKQLGFTREDFAVTGCTAVSPDDEVMSFSLDSEYEIAFAFISL